MRSPLVLASVLAVVGCSAKPVSVELRVDGETVLSCAKASVEELNPEPGGWTFQCEDGGSVYVLYDTGDGPAKGTIKTITVTPGGGQPGQDYLAGYTVSDRASCPSAEGTDQGPPALADTTGSFTFAMAQPCAKLELKLTAAK